MKFTKCLLTLLAFVACTFMSQAQDSLNVQKGLPQIPPSNVKNALESQIDKDSILIGDHVLWRMSIAPDDVVSIGVNEMPQQLVEGVEPLSQIAIDTIIVKKKIVRYEALLRLTSFDSGSYALPYMPIYLDRGNGKIDTIWYKGPVLYVNTIQVDTTNFVASPLKPQMKFPIVFDDVWPIASAVILIALIVASIIWVVRRRRANLPLFGAVKPKLPAHIVALKALEEIRSKQLWQADKVKHYYSLISDTLRTYMAERWHIQAMESTSQEVLDLLKGAQKEDDKLTDKSINELSQMFEISDLAKFAKYKPSPEENETSMVQAVRFVTETARFEEETPAASEDTTAVSEETPAIKDVELENEIEKQ